MANKEVVLTIKTYVDGELVGETAKVIPPPVDWFRRIVLGVGIPAALWIMTFQGVFR